MEKMTKKSALSLLKTFTSKKSHLIKLEKRVKELGKELTDTTNEWLALRSVVWDLETWKPHNDGIVDFGLYGKVSSPHSKREAKYWETCDQPRQFVVQLYNGSIDSFYARVGEVWYKGSKEKVKQIAADWVVNGIIPKK